MLPSIMGFTDDATYRQMAITCTGLLPPLQHRQYVIGYGEGGPCELTEIGYLRKKTSSKRPHGDVICELCWGGTDELVTDEVVFFHIHSVPWLPLELQWRSESLDNYIREHENMVKMRCCIYCRFIFVE